jgi:hypothetical protein
VELATQKPSGIRVKGDPDILDILCGALRGDEIAWPPASDKAFYTDLLGQAAHHGVDCLFWHVIQERHEHRQLPDWVKDELAERTARAVAVEMVRANDVRSLQKQLTQAGITAILMKGGALAYTHYPAPHLRYRVDTDIFIAPGDIRKIREVLPIAGYRLEGLPYKSHQFKVLRDGFGGQTIKYDVHWRSSNHAQYARVLSHVAAVDHSVAIPELGGIQALSAVHALLQACVHRAAGSYHPDRLIWLYDIHLLVSGMSESELGDFAHMAIRSGTRSICLEAVDKSCRCFVTEAAETLMQALSESASKEVARSRLAGSQLALIIDDLRELPDTRTRFDLMREYLFPPADYLLRRYGKRGAYWVPVLYVRYLLTGMFERLTLN